MADLESRFAALEGRVSELEDQAAIRKLQWAYGYYIDYNRPEEVAGLFAEDGAVVFLSGEYRGHAGVMRLYGTWFQNLFTGGRRGPVKGLLLDHFQLQDVITVAPDRKTAKGRFRGVLAGGWHDAIKDSLPEGMPQQFWLDYMMQWQADYEDGWSKTVAHLQPAAQCFPENPIGPDRLLPETDVRQTWPHRQEVAMSFAHPVLAKAFSVGDFTRLQKKWP